MCADIKLPSNMDAEKAVLGSMLLDTEAIFLALDLLQSSDFYRPAHGRLFTALTEMAGRGEPSDILLLEQDLQGRGWLEGVGGPDYLRELMTAVPSSANLEHYAGMVRDGAVRRAMVKNAMRLIESAQNAGIPLADITSEAESAFYDIAEKRAGGSAQSSTDIIRGVLEQIETGAQPVGTVMAEFQDLDALTYGYKPGSLNILAGLQSQGKSSLALNITINAARAGLAVANVLLEGTHTGFVRRALSCIARVPIYPGDIPAETDLTKILDAGNELAQLPILIDERPAQTISGMISRLRLAQKQHDIKLVIVDYIQLMRAPGEIFERMTQISTGLKLAAKELNVPVLALSQFSREGSKADRPRIYHLKGGSQLEQDADTVLILHEGEAHLDKNRDGATGSFPYYFQRNCYRFEAGTRENDNWTGRNPANGGSW